MLGNSEELVASSRFGWEWASPGGERVYTGEGLLDFDVRRTGLQAIC